RSGPRSLRAPGDALAALARGIERATARRLRRLGTAGRHHARALQRGELRLEPPQLLLHLRQLVGERQRGHDGEAGIADLAEASPPPHDARVEILRQAHETRLFARLAGPAELAAGDGGACPPHCKPPRSFAAGTERMVSMAASSL